jgi:hypothetical protein
MASTTTPTARRHAEITAVLDLFRSDMDTAPVADMAAAVLTLAPLGRSKAWKDAVAAWSQLITDHADARAWALVQGAVWACNAA